MVAGLCRLLANSGISVAPFKAQNMALNSAVTRTGHEIGRAQYLQAQAARVEPSVSMNPILLKPTGERSSQVVVRGRPIGEMSAKEYHNYKPELFDVAIEALDHLRSTFDVVLLEGAGSPAELNLLDHDIVNLRLASEAGCVAVLVGDIDPGGVFASLYGTVKILPAELASLIKGFIINKFRGDPALLLDGTDQLEALCHVPTFGVVPMLADLDLDAEDSLNVTPSSGSEPSIDVAVVHLPTMSNFTDFDPLRAESHVSIRFVRSVSELGAPDLVILPGTKSTVHDLEWLRTTGLAEQIVRLCQPDTPTTVLGICGGYQMLGSTIVDPVESGQGNVQGLGVLDCTTQFADTKVVARITGRSFDASIDGYQIHHGRVTNQKPELGWIYLADGTIEGTTQATVYGTTAHGLFDTDEFRQRFLATVADHSQKPFTSTVTSFAQRRNDQLDYLAAHLDSHLDIPTILSLLR